MSTKDHKSKTIFLKKVYIYGIIINHFTITSCPKSEKYCYSITQKVILY